MLLLMPARTRKVSYEAYLGRTTPRLQTILMPLLTPTALVRARTHGSRVGLLAGVTLWIEMQGYSHDDEPVPVYYTRGLPTLVSVAKHRLTSS